MEILTVKLTEKGLETSLKMPKFKEEASKKEIEEVAAIVDELGKKIANIFESYSPKRRFEDEDIRKALEGLFEAFVKSKK